jgi:hypothetical protein
MQRVGDPPHGQCLVTCNSRLCIRAVDIGHSLALLSQIASNPAEKGNRLRQTFAVAVGNVAVFSWRRAVFPRNGYSMRRSFHFLREKVEVLR